MEPTLSQGVGYGVIIGLGIFFAILMNLVTFIQNKFTKANSNKVDEFTSASRGLPFGLVLCGILSSWTWSLTLLQAPTESYNIGFSGGYWYAIGGLLQVSVFSIISSKIKKNANLITTFPEMAYLRFKSTAAHLSFLWCGLVCNAIVSSCILLGGAAVVNGITGVNLYAALFLIPFGVAVYVSFGGLRATFISDATHTCILIVFIIVFVFEVYTNGDKIGSPQKMWELLESLPPVEDNYKGSYLTFRSKQGAIFAVISVVTGFGLVVNDQAYLSRAVASDPKTTSAAYFFGAGAWFVIPFGISASLGLAARACANFPDFPELSTTEVSAGLASVASATYLMGTTGSIMMLLMVFLSVTSSFSGELIATSTLLSYDIYKRYVKPNASPNEVVKAAKISVFIWALFSACLATIFKGGAKISMGWLFNFLGVSTASGVFPIGLTFTWKGLNKWGAIGGSMGGMILALIVWLSTCKAYLGEINVVNLSDQWVSFAGNVTALVMGGVISIAISLIKPANFDWNTTRNSSILLSGNEINVYKPHHVLNNNYENCKIEENLKGDEIQNNEDLHSELSINTDLDLIINENIAHDSLNKQFKKYVILVAIIAILATFIIPVPLAATPYIFSPRFLTAWISVIIVWLFYTFSLTILLPIYESRKSIWRIIQNIFKNKSTSV